LTTSCMVIGIPWWWQLASVAMMQSTQSWDHLTVISFAISFSVVKSSLVQFFTSK